MYYITCYKNSISKKSIPLYPKHLLKFQRQKTVEQYHEVLNYNPILLYPAVLTCVNEMATHSFKCESKKCRRIRHCWKKTHLLNPANKEINQNKKFRKQKD